MRVTAMICGLGLLSYAAVPALANDSVLKAVKNPKNWAMQQGDYANHRYSTLDQINTSNVGKMQTARSFSTGVLRGHEGSPLVIGNMMYLTTPFPNVVYALDLDNNQQIVWKYTPKQDSTVISIQFVGNDGRILLRRIFPYNLYGNIRRSRIRPSFP